MFGLARRDVQWHVATGRSASRLSVLTVELTDAQSTRRAVEEAAPDTVFHLAAQSSVAASFDDPLGTIQNNAATLLNVLNAVREAAPSARVLVVSSGEVYGRGIPGKPIDEEVPFRPENPYAVSKCVQDLLGLQYHLAHGLSIVRVRPFNHIGPGQSDRFVASSFARQIAEIEAGQHEPIISVGNLDARREFTDVRDMVAAYRLAVERGEPGVAYNLGQGDGVAIRDLLNRLIEQCRVPVTVQVDPARLRPVDVPALVCDATLFRTQTGWRPRILLTESLRDMLDYWRGQLNVTTSL